MYMYMYMYMYVLLEVKGLIVRRNLTMHNINSYMYVQLVYTHVHVKILTSSATLLQVHLIINNIIVLLNNALVYVNECRLLTYWVNFAHSLFLYLFFLVNQLNFVPIIYKKQTVREEERERENFRKKDRFKIMYAPQCSIYTYMYIDMYMYIVCNNTEKNISKKWKNM